VYCSFLQVKTKTLLDGPCIALLHIKGQGRETGVIPTQIIYLKCTQNVSQRSLYCSAACGTLNGQSSSQGRKKC